MSTKGTSRESVVGLPNVKERNSAHLLTRTDMLVVRHACGGAREMQQVGGQAYGQMMVGGKKLLFFSTLLSSRKKCTWH